MMEARQILGLGTTEMNGREQKKGNRVREAMAHAVEPSWVPAPPISPLS